MTKEQLREEIERLVKAHWAVSPHNLLEKTPMYLDAILDKVDRYTKALVERRELEAERDSLEAVRKANNNAVVILWYRYEDGSMVPVDERIAVIEGRLGSNLSEEAR